MKRPILWPVSLSLAILLTLILSAGNGVCGDEIETIELTRKTAIAMAIRNNIDLRVRALDSSLAETNIQGSKSIYNPYLSATVDYSQTSAAGETYGTETTSGYAGINQKLPTGGSVALAGRTGPTSAVSDPLYDYTDWSSSIGISLYQPLLKNAGQDATELGISQDTYAYEESLQAFRDDVIETVFSVITEYNRLFVLHQLLESRNAAVRSAQQLLEEIKTKPNPGDNPAIELSNTEYALSQRQTDAIEAQRQVSNKEAKLRFLIGMQTKVHIVPVDPPSREEPQETEEEAMELALEQRPDLKELDISLQSNELRQKVSKRNLLPDLAVTSSFGYRGYAQDGDFNDSVSQISDGKGKYWSAGLLVSFPLGNDLAESEHRRDKIRTEQLKNQIAAAEWKIRDTIQDDNRSLISARLQMRATAKSKILAEQRVAQYQKNRRLGITSVKDLLDAENDLIYARNLELNAVENFTYQVTRLWKDIGVLLERQNVHIDTTRPEQITSGAFPTSLSTKQAMHDTQAQPVAAPTVPEEPPALPVTAVKAEIKPPAPAAPPHATQGKSTTLVTAPAVKQEPATAAGSYTLEMSGLISSELVRAKKKIQQAGLVPVVMDGPKQEREVIRLQLGEFKDLQSAQDTLIQLQNTHSGGFILKNEARNYEAFAGSFFTMAAAEEEQKRLATKNISLKLKKVSVALPTFLLTAGSFSSRATAQEAANQLQQQGLAAEVLENRQ